MTSANRLQCPPDYVGVAAITALGSLIGRRAGDKAATEDGLDGNSNLWGGFIGRPGMLKSPSMGEALKPLHHLEAEAAKDNEVTQQAYEVGLSAYKVRQQVKLSLEKDALRKNRNGPAGVEVTWASRQKSRRTSAMSPTIAVMSPLARF